jgi:hypothetical protein
LLDGGRQPQADRTCGARGRAALTESGDRRRQRLL